MTVTRERFEQGMTYADYKAQMTRNRDRLEEAEQTVHLLAGDVQFFVQIPQPLYILVLTEDWCEAAIENIPVLTRLVMDNRNIHVRFFLRDQNPDLMQQFLKDGMHAAIPTFVFFDQEFRELGRWIERPAKISELGEQRRRELVATDPAFAGVALDTPFPQLPEAARIRVIQELITFRIETRDLSDREVAREMRTVVEQGLASNG